jgi:hypothetical protein
MGTMLYGTVLTVNFDDRVLAHLQFVIGAKLRRRDSFFFSWTEALDNGGGRSTVWMNDSIPLAFRHDTPFRSQLNKEWLESLALSANSAQGLVLTGEPPTGRPVTADQIPAPSEGRTMVPTLVR